jgi:ribosomal protein L11 methylase PrmA
MIGAYEASLHPVIEEIVAQEYALVIDIGCAEGYYAVGLARRMAQVEVWARDASGKAQEMCRDLAAANGVAERVAVGGVIVHGDFEVCLARKSLVICDIEGAEADLLDPALAPGLLAADLLVETHEAMSKGIGERIADRFRATHDVQILGRKLDDSGLPEWMERLGDMDRLLALWEWRTGPTPWLWMQRR